MRYPHFVGGSFQDENPITDSEDLINYYIQHSESEGASAPNELLPTPGFQSAYTVSQGGGRAMYEMDGRSFGVVGVKLYEWFADGSSIERGTVAIDSNPATISGNGSGGGQLFITSGGAGYNYDLATDVLTLIVGLSAMQGGEAYGYFLAFAVNGDVRMSDLFDGLTWDPTQFFQRTIGPDLWTGMIVTPYGQIFLPGSQTSEFWYNAGTFPIPFAPDPSGLVEEGIAASFSLKFAGKSVVWLSTNKNGGYQVMRASGFTPQRISTHALEAQLATYPRIDDALGETYEEKGHAHYRLTLPTAKVTWDYDFSTSQWAKVQTFIAETNSYDYCHPVWHCFAFGKHLMADLASNVIYQMDSTFGLDVDGRPMRRLRQFPVLLNENRMMFYPELEIVMQVGVGLQGTVTGSSPMISMQKSDDGGLTWGNERQISIGKAGQFGTRVRWLNTGSARKRVYRIICTDPVPYRLTDAFLHGVQASSEAA